MKISNRAGFLWGIIAVVCWGLLASLNRTLTELLGTFTAGGCIYMSGGLLCFFLYPPKKRKFSVRYHVVCGSLMLLYFLFYSIGIGLAANRVQTVEVNLLNYLWPVLTVLFSVIIFKPKTSFRQMGLGILIAVYGLALSSSALAGVPLTPANLYRNFCSNPLPYLLMTGAAVCWGLYSNLLKKVDPATPIDALPYFLFLGGVVMFLLRFPFHETSTWNLQVLWQLALMALVPIGGGYFCWDKAMLAENTSSSMTFSYLTPLISAFFCSIFLKVHLSWQFYLACSLVIAGALLCRFAIVKKK